MVLPDQMRMESGKHHAGTMPLHVLGIPRQPILSAISNAAKHILKVAP